MRLWSGHDAEVSAWAGEQVGRVFYQPHLAIGIIDQQNEIRGAVIFGDFYRNGNVEVTWIGAGTLQRGIIRELLSLVFEFWDAARLTAKTARSNRKTVAKLLIKAGFRFEVTQPRYFGPDKADDALVYVMTKADAQRRWIGD